MILFLFYFVYSVAVFVAGMVVGAMLATGDFYGH